MGVFGCYQGVCFRLSKPCGVLGLVLGVLSREKKPCGVLEMPSGLLKMPSHVIRTSENMVLFAHVLGGQNPCQNGVVLGGQNMVFSGLFSSWSEPLSEPPLLWGSLPAQLLGGLTWQLTWSSKPLKHR